MNKVQLSRLTDLLKDESNVALNEAAGDLVDALKVYCELGSRHSEKLMHAKRGAFVKALVALGISDTEAAVLAKTFVDAVYAGKADWDEFGTGNLRPTASSGRSM